MPLFGQFPFGPSELAGIGGLVALAFIPYLLLGLAVPYAVLYVKDRRNEEHDSEIGLKSALYFMLSLSILLILSGLTVLVVDFLTEEDRMPAAARRSSEFSDIQRTAFAMMVSGFAIGLFHLVVILGFTNDRRYPATRRVFVGWRLAICSLIVLIAFTVLVIQVFQIRRPPRVGPGVAHPLAADPLLRQRPDRTPPPISDRGLKSQCALRPHVGGCVQGVCV